MLGHTNTGGVSELYVTHFGGERQRGIAVEGRRHRGWVSYAFYTGYLLISLFVWTIQRPRIRGVASLDPRTSHLLGWVEPQLLDVPQETEQSAHLLAAHGRGQVGDLDDSSPWYSAHFTN